MYERVRIALPLWARPKVGALFRYNLIDRLRRCGAAHDATLLAFGFEGPRALRCVLLGEAAANGRALKGLKVGTALSLRHQGIRGEVGAVGRVRVDSAIDAVVWAHRGPLEGRRGPRRPLATPWSSHRDLLGYREAVFFDAKPLRRSVDPGDVHRRCGGRPALPPPMPASGGWALGTLLRICASVIGVVPSDRRCFGLFVHLARQAGFPTRDVAEAICLTPRRVRQIAAEPVYHFDLVRRALADPQLQRVP